MTDKIRAISVNLATFGFWNQYPMEMRSLFHKDVKTLSLPYKNESLQDTQYRLLRSMGLNKVPLKGDKPVLEYENFSDSLKEKITYIRRQILEQFGTRPVVFANMLKGMKGDWLYQDELRHYSKLGWIKALETIVQELDVTLVINEGPEIWRTEKQLYPVSLETPELKKYEEKTPHEEILSLYKHLEALPGKKATLFLLNDNVDTVTLSALLYIAKISGGLLLDIQTGSSHLAEWMNIPEIMLPGDERHNHALSERENLKKIYRYFDFNTGKSTPKNRSNFARQVMDNLLKLMTPKSIEKWFSIDGKMNSPIILKSSA